MMPRRKRRRAAVPEIPPPARGIEPGAWVFFPVEPGLSRPGKVLREIRRGANKGWLEVQRPAQQKADGNGGLSWIPGQKYTVRPVNCTRVPEEQLKKTMAREAAGEDLLCGGRANAVPVSVSAPGAPVPPLLDPTPEEETGMIYEAIPGERINRAALEAVRQRCNKMIHNDRIFKIVLTYEQVAVLKEATATKQEATPEMLVPASEDPPWDESGGMERG